ncbi:hypothetical protein LBMAG42_13650 [Deltaproteobacteria bacterium]|nr:hypothetical protein LBMAG42_13650 [Deltaproteobacteria bacterium]
MSLLLLALLSACPADPTVDLEKDGDDDRYPASEDCDDGNAAVFPGASEICDGVDNNCDDVIDEGVEEVQYTDADGDNYGDPNAPIATCGETIAGVVHNDSDCDDTNATVNPMGDETLALCDDLDNDCDGLTDGGLRVPADHALPSFAVGAARDGEVVCVAAGTYVDNIDFGGDDVWLMGVAGAEATILQGAGDQGPVVSFDTRESSDARLSGFTITGGDDASGAGIYIRGADPTLEDLIVTGNSCQNADGACYGTGVYAEDSEFAMSNVVISENTQMSTYSYYPYNYGAGLALVRSSPTLSNITIADNEVDFPSNSYYGAAAGAGMYVNGGDLDAANIVISGNVIHKNGTGYAYGVGLYLYNSKGWYENIAIVDNSSNAYAVYGGGLDAAEYASPVFQNVVIANNVAGGDETYAAYGGGVFFTYDSAYIEQADIVGNTVVATTGGGGGGIYGYYYAAPTLVNTSVWNNAALITGVAWGGAVMFDPSYPASSMTFSYSSLSANGDNPYQYTTTPVGTNDNIEGTPAYTDVSSPSALDWDLTLGAGSDLRNAGDPEIDDADGSRSDIGSRGGSSGDAW